MSEPIITSETKSGFKTAVKFLGKALLWVVVAVIGLFILLSADWSWERFSYAAMIVIGLLYIQDIENSAKAAHHEAMQAKSKAKYLESQSHLLAERIRRLETQIESVAH